MKSLSKHILEKLLINRNYRPGVDWKSTNSVLEIQCTLTDSENNFIDFDVIQNTKFKYVNNELYLGKGRGFLWGNSYDEENIVQTDDSYIIYYIDKSNAGNDRLHIIINELRKNDIIDLLSYIQDNIGKKFSFKYICDKLNSNSIIDNNIEKFNKTYSMTNDFQDINDLISAVKKFRHND